MTKNMENWMEKFERSKDEQRERELNIKLEKLLNLLDEAYKDEDRIKFLEEIIKVYGELRTDACEYDEKDCVSKKKELAEIRFKIKKQEYMKEVESQSWNEYEQEEQMLDKEYDEER